MTAGQRSQARSLFLMGFSLLLEEVFNSVPDHLGQDGKQDRPSATPVLDDLVDGCLRSPAGNYAAPLINR